MDIDNLKQEKLKIESEIGIMISSFSKKYNVIINDINVYYEEIMRCSSGKVETSEPKVQLKIEL